MGCICRITCPLLHINLLCVSIQFLLSLVPLWLCEEDWSFCTLSLPFLCVVAVFFYCSIVVMLLCFLYLQRAKVLLGEEHSGESSLHALLLQSSILCNLYCFACTGLAGIVPWGDKVWSPECKGPGTEPWICKELGYGCGWLACSLNPYTVGVLPQHV